MDKEKDGRVVRTKRKTGERYGQRERRESGMDKEKDGRVVRIRRKTGEW